MRILGLDVGGAHVKTALLRVTGEVEPEFPPRKTYPFELWKNPAGLGALLRSIRDVEKPDAIALTMTGELADVFKTRAEGVRHIVNSATEAMAPADVNVVDVDGRLVSAREALRKPARVASANWSATVQWVSRHVMDCLVVDIGSTTTDILPVKRGAPAVRGKTDLERLMAGELRYTGYLRTAVCAVAPTLKVRGVIVKTCPEHFAIIGDAHLYLGEIGAKEYTTPTPDNGPKTKRGAALRLARAVLSSPHELGERELDSIARQIVKAQVETIAEGMRRVIKEGRLNSAPIVLIGPGRIYRSELSKRVNERFIEKVGMQPVDRIDPAACCAALFVR